MTDTSYITAENGPIRVACIGDSITYGDRIDDREQNCYPAKLQDLLGAGWNIRNFGLNGCTLLKKGDRPYWNEPEIKGIRDFDPEIAVVLLGVNDAKSRNWAYRSDFYTDYLDFIRYLKSLPSHRDIFACFPTPVFGPMYDMDPRVIWQKQIPLIRKAAAKEQINTIDLYRALSKHRDLFPDKVHPNAGGAKLIAEQVYAAIKNIHG